MWKIRRWKRCSLQVWNVLYSLKNIKGPYTRLPLIPGHGGTTTYDGLVLAKANGLWNCIETITLTYYGIVSSLLARTTADRLWNGIEEDETL